MANPNRALAYVAKRPFSFVCYASGPADAAAKVAALVADGFDAKWTRLKIGPRPTAKNGWKQAYSFNVWQREREPRTLR